jgi:hypothetical protein
MALIEPEELRLESNRPEYSIELTVLLQDAADYIELLRRQLHEAHSCNADSERLNWLAQQAHEEYSEPAHRSYFKLPMVLKHKHGQVAHNLREAIDLVMKPRHHE